MTDVAEKLYHQALSLPPIERVQLVENILSSFNDSGFEASEKEWFKELDTRWEMFKSGQMKSKDASVLFSEINNSLK